MIHKSKIDVIRDTLYASEVMGSPYHRRRVEDALEKLQEIESELKELRRKELHRIWNGDNISLEEAVGHVLRDLAEEDAIPRPIYSDHVCTEKIYQCVGE